MEPSIMQKQFVRTLLLVFVLLDAALVQVAAQPDPVRREFIIQNFRTESGIVLPEARIVYGTYGKLNEAADNAVLLPSHFMATLNGYDWLIGPGRALDPDKLFIIATELFGNGRSSSPSNTPEPHKGPRFPVVTIRDNVNATHRLLTEQLNIKHLRAVIGFSMGAQQAFQWAVSHPDFMDRIVVTSGTAKTHPHGVVRLEGQITAITSDAAFNGGNYATQPAKGIEATSIVWAAWLFSQEWWRTELWKTKAPTFPLVLDRYRRLFATADANDLISQMRIWQAHNVGDTAPFGGDLEKALQSIKVPVLYMPSETDLYFPVTDARYEAAFIPKCTLLVIPSLWGHTAGAAGSPEDGNFVNEKISAFMSGKL
jgi:homoserine O-acetyltransferase